MVAVGTFLDLALRYMLQLGTDRAVLNTCVCSYTKGSWSMGLLGCTDHLVKNTLLLTQSVLISSAKY